MKPLIESIRLPQQSRDQLVRLKRITGIQHWNTLCRWAFCLSLTDPNKPTMSQAPSEGGVEMTWKTFAGEHADLFQALLIFRMKEDDIPVGKKNANAALRAHLIRGIGSLTAQRQLNSVAGLLEMAKED